MKFYNSTTSKPVLIIDIDYMYIVVADFAPWIAKKPEEYHYNDAKWLLVKKEFKPSPSDSLLNDNVLFWETVELNQPGFYRNIIKTLFN